jgi:hypothetical protein
MAIIGHTAAAMNIFLDIPFVLRAVSQSLYGEPGPEIKISSEFLEYIRRVDRKDPTGVFDEYLGDWWNFENEWETHSTEVDLIAAFGWHYTKVNENLHSVLVLTLLPIGSTGTFDQIKTPVP